MSSAILGSRDLEARLSLDRVLLIHGGGRRTMVVLGTQRMLRYLKLDGYPEVESFALQASCYDADGRLMAERSWRSPASEEAVFDSREVLGEGPARPLEGSVLLTVAGARFKAPLPAGLPAPRGDFNGVHLVFHPGHFVTGVHLYHGVDFRPWLFLAKLYLRRCVKRLLALAADPLSLMRPRPWRREAVGASVVHSTAQGRGRGLVVMHSDNTAPPAVGFLEYRSQAGEVRRRALPALRRHSTLLWEVPPANGADEWGQILCVMPPHGVSRFVTGERFADGRLTFDHNYFQQPQTSVDKVKDEIRWFDPSLLRDGVIGPSHPWPCFHSAAVESLVAMCNQFDPGTPKTYDLRVFDNHGRLILEKLEAVRLEPYGLKVLSVSDELKRAGVAQLEGTYLVTHNAGAAGSRLPNRIHAQGIYRFAGGYWNAVQSDASIWASPDPKVPGIEALSRAKVRRKQYWFAPVLDSEEVETLLPVANLSYSLHYDKPVTLGLRYSEGDRVLGEREVSLKPFAAVVLNTHELFGGLMTSRRGGYSAGCVTIYPKTGITYCASFMVRDKSSGVFVLEHVLPLPKFSHEIAS